MPSIASVSGSLRKELRKFRVTPQAGDDWCPFANFRGRFREMQVKIIRLRSAADDEFRGSPNPQASLF
jgi:hypothetical protein